MNDGSVCSIGRNGLETQAAKAFAFGTHFLEQAACREFRPSLSATFVEFPQKTHHSNAVAQVRFAESLLFDRVLAGAEEGNGRLLFALAQQALLDA